MLNQFYEEDFERYCEEQFWGTCLQMAVLKCFFFLSFERVGEFLKELLDKLGGDPAMVSLLEIEVLLRLRRSATRQMRLI